MSQYHSEIYDDNDDRLKREERFYELTKTVVRLVHPLLSPTICTPEQARIDYFNHPHFHKVVQEIVHFIIAEKPDAEKHLLQMVEIDHIIRNTNLFLEGK
jgi:hypothetical protein